jgi:hypothetical protein
LSIAFIHKSMDVKKANVNGCEKAAGNKKPAQALGCMRVSKLPDAAEACLWW